MCFLMLNLYISLCNVCARICGLNSNHIQHGNNQPRQEVEDGYIFVNNVVNIYTIKPMIFMVQY